MKSTIDIQAPISEIWKRLTDPTLMRAWMFDDDIEIVTDWQIGSPFIIRGRLHGIRFENKGSVLKFEQEQRLSYSHLSSLSPLPDRAENYTVIEFSLESANGHSIVNLELSNFPTETIRKHLAFYWRSALVALKRSLEVV